MWLSDRPLSCDNGLLRARIKVPPVAAMFPEWRLWTLSSDLDPVKEAIKKSPSLPARFSTLAVSASYQDLPSAVPKAISPNWGKGRRGATGPGPGGASLIETD